MLRRLKNVRKSDKKDFRDKCITMKEDFRLYREKMAEYSAAVEQRLKNAIRLNAQEVSTTPDISADGMLLIIIKSI